MQKRQDTTLPPRNDKKANAQPSTSRSGLRAQSANDDDAAAHAAAESITSSLLFDDLGALVVPAGRADAVREGRLTAVGARRDVGE